MARWGRARSLLLVAVLAVPASMATGPEAPGAQGHANCGTAAAPVELANATLLQGHISTGKGWCIFRFATPPGAEHIVVDLDTDLNRNLYVRHGAPPTLAEWDCSPFIPQGTESCELAGPGGDWYVGVHNFVGVQGNFTLLATHGVAPDHCGPPTLTPGVPLTTRIAPSKAAWCHYTFTMPPGQGWVRVHTESQPDRDLYVRERERPTPHLFHCAMRASYGSERCGFSDPQPGTWHVSVHNEAGVAGEFTVDVQHGPEPWNACPALTPLTLDVPATISFNSTYNQACYLAFEVPAGAEQVRLHMSSPIPDRTASAAPGIVPFTDFKFPPCWEPSDDAEECWVNEPAPGTWYVEVFNVPSWGSTATLTASAGPRAPCGNHSKPHELVLGTEVVSTMPTIGGWMCWYALDVPAGAGAVVHSYLRSTDGRDMLVAPAGITLCPVGVIVPGGHEDCVLPAVPSTWTLRVWNQAGSSDVFTLGTEVLP